MAAWKLAKNTWNVGLFAKLATKAAMGARSHAAMLASARDRGMGRYFSGLSRQRHMYHVPMERYGRQVSVNRSMD